VDPYGVGRMSMRELERNVKIASHIREQVFHYLVIY
jgi:hypothetical protein